MERLFCCRIFIYKLRFMYITLAMIKQHLNIEATYTAEDTYLTHLYNVAEKVVERHIDFILEDYEDEDGNIPTPLQHAMLLYIGDLYQSREGNAYGVTVTQIPFAYEYLLSLYRDYSGLYSQSTEDEMIDEICRHLVIQTGGVLTIDSAYRERCLAHGGAKSKAYQRLFERVLESATIDANGNITINF